MQLHGSAIGSRSYTFAFITSEGITLRVVCIEFLPPNF